MGTRYAYALPDAAASAVSAVSPQEIRHALRLPEQEDSRQL